MKKKWLKYVAVVMLLIVLVAGALWAGTLDEPAAQMYETGAVNAKRMAADTVAAESAMDYGVNAVSTMSSRSASGGAQPTPQTQRKLVRTVDMTIRTQRFDEAAAHVQALLAQSGGYVEYSYQQGEQSSRRLTLSMRVPSDQLDAFLTGMEGAGRVTDRSESTTDMTTQYQDNEARLQTLYAKRDRLNELLVKAENVADLIEVEAAIADTQYEIDRYETSQRSIDNQVDMSAVSVTLMEERPADTASADISLGERMRAALAASVEWLGGFAQDLAVFLVIVAPVAVPAAVIVLIVVIVRKRKGK